MAECPVLAIREALWMERFRRWLALSIVVAVVVVGVCHGAWLVKEVHQRRRLSTFCYDPSTGNFTFTYSNFTGNSSYTGNCTSTQNTTVRNVTSTPAPTVPKPSPDIPSPLPPPPPPPTPTPTPTPTPPAPVPTPPAPSPPNPPPLLFPPTPSPQPVAPPPSPSSGKWLAASGAASVGAILGGVIGGSAALLLVAATALWCYRRRIALWCFGKKTETENPSVQHFPDRTVSGSIAPTIHASGHVGRLLGASWRVYTFTELLQATDSFAAKNFIGEGALGAVYCGVTSEGLLVAVKRLKPLSIPTASIAEEGTAKQVVKEILALAGTRHRNVCSLLGYCFEGDESCIVLPFAEHGSLDKALQRGILQWSVRVQIALGIARGLSYLHNDCDPVIIHRDVKAANILLAEDYTPKVADFGLVRLLETNQTIMTSALRGTYGYMAPELTITGQVNQKSDVYAFGVVLLELLTGRRAVGKKPSGEPLSLILWVAQQRQANEPIIDPTLGGAFDPDEAGELESLAWQCVQPSNARRPRMSDLVFGIERLSLRRESRGVPSSAEQTAVPSWQEVSGPHHISGESSPSSFTGSRERQPDWSRFTDSLSADLSMQQQFTGIQYGR